MRLTDIEKLIEAANAVIAAHDAQSLNPVPHDSVRIETLRKAIQDVLNSER